METSSKTPEAFKIKGNWNRLSKKLKEKFTQLTDVDLVFEPGKETDLLKRIGVKINRKQEDVINIIRKGELELG